MKREIKKILVIRFRRVGDAVISTVLCSTLKRTFPHAQIDYVLNEGIAPLFEHHPDIDRIITLSDYDQAGFFRYIRKVKSIVKREKYDLIVDTRATIKTLWFSLFSLSTPFRVGIKKSYDKYLLNLRSKDDFLDTDDEVTKTLCLLQPLEKYYPLSYVRNFRLYVTDKEKEKYRQYMHEQRIDFSKPVILCAVTTRLEHKRWKIEYMQSILQKMIDTYDAQLIFNYSGEIEKSDAITLYRNMNRHPNILIDLEAKNLRQLAALMANVDFFFGNEGGPRHISQAFDVPSYAVYSPTISKNVWLPNACKRYQGIQYLDIHGFPESGQLSDQQKFDLITDEEVWKKLNPMLNQFLVHDVQ